MTNINVVLIAAAFVLAVAAIYILYSIIMYQGYHNGKNDELQLSTKNILDQVEVLFDKGEYALVQLLASKYLDRVPSHKKVRQYLAKAYYWDKKYNNAIKQCLTILKKEPNNIDTRKVLGDCYIQKEMLGKAIKEYEAIFEFRGNDKEVVRTLAELYRDSEQIFSSISTYNILADLVDENDEIAEVQMILAELNEQAKDYPAAFEAYKTRLGIYPTDIVTNQKLVELHMKLKNYPKAIETLMYMLTFVGDQKALQWVYERLVELFVETEEFEKAIEYSNKLLEVQGSDKFKIKNDIAVFNMRLNQFDKGIAILEELVMMTQNGYEVTLQLCDSYIICKEYEKALEKYLALLDKATQKEAKNVNSLICELYIEWAIEEADKDNFDAAFGLLEKAADYNSQNSEIYYYKAVNLIRKKNSTAAIDLLIQALDLDKQKTYHAKYYLALADAHHDLNHFFEEKKALSDLLKIDNKHPIGLYRSGLMYAIQHDSKNAEEYFKKALQYDPTLIHAKYNLALLYESNNRDRAKELFLEVLEQDPNYEEAKRALGDLTASDYY